MPARSPDRSYRFRRSIREMPSMPSTSSAATRYRYTDTISFVLVHVACLGAIWTGVQAADVALGVGLYVVRMFGITAGYHRYFSHRTYKTGRVFQFLLALLAQTSAQRGALWWAAHHRAHHRHSDTELDVHSPVVRGFWYSHLGWIFAEQHHATDMTAVRDLARFPELRWLDRMPYVPAIALGVAVWLAFGWSGLVVGFFWSTVALWHATFAINSLAHVLGSRRYLTADQSRNNWWLALLTLGEGWHNNHHHYQSAARQGFRWYEIDLSYYALRALAAVGLVRDLRLPPADVVRADRRLGRAVVDKAAAQLAAAFDMAPAVAAVRAALAARRARLDAPLDALHHEFDVLHHQVAALVDDWQHRLEGNVEAARRELAALLAEAHLPAMPTAADLRARAAAMFARTPSMNDIVERARHKLIDSLCDALLPRPGTPVLA